MRQKDFKHNVSAGVLFLIFMLVIPVATNSTTSDTIANVQKSPINLYFKVVTFDPVYDNLEIPIELKYTYKENEEGYFIIQFSDTIKMEWINKLQIYGVIFHHYVPDQAYIVFLEKGTKQQIQNLPFIRFVGPYHPLYKLIDPELLERIGEVGILISVFEDGDLTEVKEKIKEFEGNIISLYDSNIEVRIDALKIIDIARLPMVKWLQEKHTEGPFMNNIREYTGTNYVHSVGQYQGEGIIGAVKDTGVDENHHEFADRITLDYDPHIDNPRHGTPCFGEIFSSGIEPQAKGILPKGEGYVTLMSVPRIESIRRVAEDYNGVFQSNSWGEWEDYGEYTDFSRQDDEAVLTYDVTVVYGAGNEGYEPFTVSTDSAAKNVIGVGGVWHYDNSDPSEHEWDDKGFEAAPGQGPTNDYRIKPDLVGPFDMIFTTDWLGTKGYNTQPSPEGDYHESFGGTSGATPIVSGSAGLTYQMYTDNHFGNNPEGGKPHASTIKALLISTAYQYEFSQANRYQQGWGTPDLKYMYDLGTEGNYFIVNEDVSLLVGESEIYSVSVTDDHPLKISLVWTDPPSSPTATFHLVNDLHLVAYSPSETIYYGNCGLYDSKWSVPYPSEDCENHDFLNNVENIFIESPERGIWKIFIYANEINDDGNLQTPELDQPFALVASGAKGVKSLTYEDPYNSWDPAIAVSDDYTYVVWTDERDLNDEIYFKRSTDNGITWDDGDSDPMNDNYDHTRRLTFTSQDSRYPSIDAIGTDIHVVWEENEQDILYIRSIDGGATWSQPTKLNIELTSSVGATDISATGPFVHAIWATGNNIMYVRGTSSAQGMTWTNEMPVSTTPGSNKLWPRIASAEDDWGFRVHATWVAILTGESDYEIFYKKSMDNGFTWVDSWGQPFDYKLTDDIYEQYLPDIALGGPLNGDFVFITWQDYRMGRWDIYYRRGQVWGDIWDAEMELNEPKESPFDTLWPRISAWGGNIFVTWTDYRDYWPNGYIEVFVKENLAGGGPVGWSDDIRMTYTQEESGYPVAIDTERSKGTHIAWREGYEEVPFTYGEIYHFQW